MQPKKLALEWESGDRAAVPAVALMHSVYWLGLVISLALGSYISKMRRADSTTAKVVAS